MLLLAAAMETEMDSSTDEELNITSDKNIFSAESQRSILELKLQLLSKESEEKYYEVSLEIHRWSKCCCFYHRLHKIVLERLISSEKTSTQRGFFVWNTLIQRAERQTPNFDCSTGKVNHY